jgi:hypothetical protein
MNFADEESDEEELKPVVKYAFILKEEEYEDEDEDLEIQGWDGFGTHLNFFHIQY